MVPSVIFLIEVSSISFESFIISMLNLFKTEKYSSHVWEEY
jgi:hypothetical protein